jgi:hypothetical protein
MIFEYDVFTDGCYTTDFVGRCDLFKDENDFLATMEVEFECEGKNLEDVEICYVRFYPSGINGSSDEFPGGCYSFCKKAKGAIKCYRIRNE